MDVATLRNEIEGEVLQGCDTGYLRDGVNTGVSVHKVLSTCADKARMPGEFVVTSARCSRPSPHHFSFPGRLFHLL
jgi:hypothetical protein